MGSESLYHVRIHLLHRHCDLPIYPWRIRSFDQPFDAYVEFYLGRTLLTISGRCVDVVD